MSDGTESYSARIDGSDSYSSDGTAGSPQLNSHLETTEQSPAPAVQSSIHPDIVIRDTATEVADTGSKTKSTESNENAPQRLLLVSNRIRSAHTMQSSMLPNVTLVLFKHDQCNLDGVLGSIATNVGVTKFESIGLVFNCSGSTITLCGSDEKLLTKESILESNSVREFFSTLVNNHIDRDWVNARIDLLMCSAAHTMDGNIISSELTQLTQLPCALHRDLVGIDSVITRIAEKANERTVGSLYFYTDKLRPASSKQNMSLFEKIRTVGKGAYGSAVLYRKKDDDSLVILKEVNMHDLNAQERQMALNEVRVLSMLEHPNVISYFDSFEEDGILMIEMEYADGGTLAQYLSAHAEQSIEERVILDMFQQMVAAIKHIHGHNILHRDLKTANVFLTKDGVVKMGDFGISKMLTTGGKNANTVVGTPYYISPEMCEGKPYGPKSDIWSLGCILYEMACLERTFEASNLPAVVTKIVKGVYPPVKGSYSQSFKDLVDKMLDKEPKSRPSAEELWTEFLPPIMSRYNNGNDEDEEDQSISTDSSKKKKKTASVLYYMSTHNLSLSPIRLPSKIKIKQIAVGVDHAILVSQECVVLSYGNNSDGQLGHGDEIPRTHPTVIEALKGKSINRAACGDRFSVFGSSNGILITCGDGQSGCLGQGDYQSLSKPKLIEELLHVDVVSFHCGPQHVAVVGNDGSVYTWGSGLHGKLGLGTEEDSLLPQKVTFSEPVIVTDIFCSDTGTMFLSDVGSVWACGNNKYNKLGLNNRQGFLAALKNAFNKTEVDGTKVPMLIRDLCRFRITTISLGQDHTAVLTEGGKVITFGRNVEGQLGSGDTRPQQGLTHIRPLNDVQTVSMSCSALSTVVSLTSGQLLFWGSRHKSPPDPELYKSLDPMSKRLSIDRQQSANSTKSLSQASLNGSHSSDAANKLNSGSLSKPSGSLESDKRHHSLTASNGSAEQGVVPPDIGVKLHTDGDTGSTATRAEETKLYDRQSSDGLEVQLEPTPLMHFQSEQSESVVLTGFQCHRENLFILVETTALPAQKKLKKRNSVQRDLRSYTNFTNSASSREAGDELSNSEASEVDTLGTMPSWIKQELEDAAPDPINRHDSSDNSDTPDERDLSGAAIVRVKSRVSPHTTRPSGKAAVFTKRTPTTAGTTATIRNRDNVERLIYNEDDESDVDEESTVDQERNYHTVSAHHHPNERSRMPDPPIRSQGKPKASRVVRAVQPQTISPHSDMVRQSGSANQRFYSRREEDLQLEVQRLRREAEASELRMSQLEESYNRKVEAVKQETVQRAAERESQLQQDMKLLRDELSAQNRQMSENFKLVVKLQEQLVHMQTQGSNSNSNSTSNLNDGSTSNVNKNTPSSTGRSSICVIQ